MVPRNSVFPWRVVIITQFFIHSIRSGTFQPNHRRFTPGKPRSQPRVLLWNGSTYSLRGARLKDPRKIFRGVAPTRGAFL